MSYLLLTGSTGLVGRYVLRQLLERGQRVAVMVRGSKMESARQRIDTVMRHWESIAGRSLRRPVVLEGDLCSESICDRRDTIDWVTRNCDSILHSAARMTFRPDKRGEPHRTNVGGTQNLVNFCQTTGIRRFHHVSTAYICGLREGRVLESEVDLGQQLGNVYEESKLGAEKLLREADCIDELTIYRPASVVGDSQTGYCTSLHGFYLPLQLAYMIADRISPEEMDQRFFSRLGLEGNEHKNLVPVDWLATAIVDLYSRPECHQNTYHLASPNPVTVQLIQRIIQRAISEHSDRRPARPLTDSEMAMVEQAFHDHMLIYQSHWRDDPVFDLTNTSAALPHLPCPEMDEDVLLRVAAYPVQHRFTLGKYEAPPSPFCSQEQLSPLLRTSAPSPDQHVISVDVTGVGGGQWHLVSREGRVTQAGLGLGPETAPCFYLNADTYASLAEGRLSIEQSIQTGRLLLEGANGATDNCLNILNQVLTSSEAKQPVA
ncbi:MAG: SDR family oxidoreductase [Pirellulales bacterium]|nr:SDR family oxidoreductase [Pirellulales bacterium]